MDFTLRAEYGSGVPDAFTGLPFASMDDAAAYIEKSCDEGAWPEGFNAVLTETATGKEWIYTDGWESI